MAIETRSATKRRAYQAAKELEMDWAEWALTKLKDLVEWPFQFAKRNTCTALFTLTTLTLLLLAYFTSNLYEYLWALATGHETQLSFSRK